MSAPTHRRTSGDFGPARRPPSGGLLESWRRYPPSLSLLRFFLGVTFVYAGVQKFADPSFFDSSSRLHRYPAARVRTGEPDRSAALTLRAHIGPDRHRDRARGDRDRARHAPRHRARDLRFRGLRGERRALAFRHMARASVLPRFRLDLRRRLARVAGRCTGDRAPSGTANCDRAAAHPERSRSARAAPWRHGSPPLGRGRRHRASLRRECSSGDRSRGHRLSFSGRRNAGSRQTTGSTGNSPSSAQSAAPSVRGKQIASLDRLNVGDAMAFNDPGVGPAVLLRTGRNSVVAFSRICTHAGCEVGYDSSARILVCPCHGAEFDPSHGGRPIAGPTSTPLPSVDVAIDPSSGDVVLPSG